MPGEEVTSRQFGAVCEPQNEQQLAHTLVEGYEEMPGCVRLRSMASLRSKRAHTDSRVVMLPRGLHLRLSV